jgi:hypothetical protein
MNRIGNGMKSFFEKTGPGLKIAILTAPFLLGIRAPQAQPAPGHTNIKRVILYDYTVSGGHSTSRQVLRQSMRALALKYKFQLDTTDRPADITSTYLSGAQILATSNGDGDVFTSAAAKQAVQDFVEKDGHAIAMFHASGAFIPCPTNGQENLSDAGCLFLARVAVRQYFTHNPDRTPAPIYVDSVAKGQVPPNAKAGTPAAAINHGIMNPETKAIFNGLPRTFPGLKDEWYSFRDTPRLQGDMTVGGAVESRVNVLLSMNEGTFNPASKTGDHPIAWTRKMGNGLGAFNSAGHDATPGEILYFQQDSVIQRFDWQLMRYLAKDFVGCMDPKFKEYNPEATVSALTPSDPVNPCSTPTTFITAKDRKSQFSASAGSRSILVSINSEGKHSVRVADIHGKTVFQTNGFGKRDLEIPGLQNGIYFVKVNAAKENKVQRISLY